MIVFEARIYVAIAIAVWVMWRITLWQRRSRDPIREAALAVLLLWSLAVVRLTLFPLKIVLYDWHASINAVPFASMLQLVTETNPTVARYNILGNIALFVPFGVLLPLLFDRLRTLLPVLWRVAVISGTIELAQLASRARATDVDDVILNSVGAALGFALYTLMARRLQRSDERRAFVARLGAGDGKEPLLAGWVPIAATAAIVVPMMYSTVIGETLGDGMAGILGYALEDWPAGQVAAQAETGGHTFVSISEGPPTAERIVLYDFVEVLPGRFTWVGTAELPPGEGSQYGWTVTAFNVEREVGPVVAVWGRNLAGATTMVINGNGMSERLIMPAAPHFVVAFRLALSAEMLAAPSFEDFSFRLLAADGTDVSHRFELVGR
ncbi:MAG: VanZ family protein [Acidimicrobiia bacterium]|nr:VanZ family protein [Acidimicrobiia bacterium]